MYRENMDLVKQFDPEVGNAIQSEYDRQRRNIELIASENIVSPAVLAAMGTVLTNKYAEGYPGKRYYGGCECVDVVEDIARDRACKLFGRQTMPTYSPTAALQANLAVYFALVQAGRYRAGHEPGPRRPSDPRQPGEHFRQATYNVVPYGLNPETERIDYDEVRALAKEHKPKMIIAGASPPIPASIRFR